MNGLTILVLAVVGTFAYVLGRKDAFEEIEHHKEMERLFGPDWRNPYEVPEDSLTERPQKSRYRLGQGMGD